ncbi:MAG: hypothetical protein V7L31_09805 [Nostoc sp.]
MSKEVRFPTRNGLNAQLPLTELGTVLPDTQFKFCQPKGDRIKASTIISL